MSNFNEIFRKDTTYDNIKSHKKVGLYPLSKRYIFRKTTRGGGRGGFDPQAFLGLNLYSKSTNWRLLKKYVKTNEKFQSSSQPKLYLKLNSFISIIRVTWRRYEEHLISR